MNDNHDYKSDRERLEALLDHRHPHLADVNNEDVINRLFECFRSPDLNEQVEALTALQNELAAKAGGII